MRVVMFAFRIFRAAVFAEPTIAKIVEVVGLNHATLNRAVGRQSLQVTARAK